MILNPLAHIKTPFKELFGIPRQAYLCPEIEGVIQIPFETLPHEAFAGLEGFSHLWLISYFHRSSRDLVKVRPPRLKGKEKLGVMATRTPDRLNPIGLSLVSLKKIEVKNGSTFITVGGVDLLDGTPILDVKPYLPYDAVDATAGWTEKEEHPKLAVEWKFESKLSQKEKKQIESYLSLDPRPRFQIVDKTYANRFGSYDISWMVQDQTVFILDLKPLS